MLETELKKIHVAIEKNTDTLEKLLSLMMLNNKSPLEVPSYHNALMMSEDITQKTSDTMQTVSPENSEISFGPSELSKLKITAEEVKQLAKNLMVAGVDRKVIKEIITKLGASSIKELDQQGLDRFYASLLQLSSKDD